MITEQGSDQCIQQNIIRSHLAAMFFDKKNSIGFSPRSLAYIVSGCWSAEQCWVSSHGVVLKSSQTVVGYSHSFVSLLLWYILQAGHHCGLEGILARLVLSVLLQNHADYLPVSRTQVSRHEGSRQEPTPILHVEGVGQVLSSATAPNYQFVKNNQQLQQKSLLFGNCREVPLASVQCNPFPELEASFGTKRCPCSAGLPSPLSLGNSIQITFIQYIFVS